MSHVRFVSSLLSTALVGTGLAVAIPGGASLAPSTAHAQAPTTPVTRPDLVSAQVTARTSKKRVEVTDLRTETTTTFANPNGSLTTEAASGPVRIRRGAAWAPIDTTLVLSNGTVRPRAAAGNPTFSSGGDSDLASLAPAGKKIALRWPGRLPAPTLRGDTATYAAVRPGIDLVLQARRQGFEQSFILHARPGTAPVFRLPLKLSGLAVSKAANGSLRFTDASGRLVAESPQPRMWGAAKDAAGDPKREAPVATRLNDTPGGPEIEMRPDLSFLRDPNVTYPVTVDPTIQMTILADTWVAQNSTVTQGTSTDLRAGKYSGTAAVQRSFMKYDSSAYSNRRVQSATLALYNYYSPACTAKETRIYALSGAFDNNTLWTNQPGAVPTIYGTATASHGATGCAGNWIRFDVTALIDRWATGALTNFGLMVRAADEADTGAWKKFYSSDYSNTAYIPTLSVTYNTYPVIDRIESPRHESYVPTRTPQFRPVYRDPDGASGYADVEVWNSGLTALVVSGRSGLTMSGATAAWTVPTTAPLADGGLYAWRARAYDRTDYGQAWTAFTYFTVDATAPPAPSVSSAEYPSGVWSAKTPSGTATFNFGPTATNVHHYLYSLDNDNPAAATPNFISSVTLAPAEGYHHLYVWAENFAGLIGGVTDYHFGVGTGAVTSPAEGAQTQRRTTLRAVARPGMTSVRFKYRRGDSETWRDVNPATVTSGGAPLNGWPVATTSTATGVTSPDLVWDVAADAGDDGPVSIEACFAESGGAEACTPPVHISLEASSFGGSYATAPVGPGAVSLLTGNLSVAATDVDIVAHVSDLIVTRTFYSKSPADASSGSFGPGWTSTLPVDSAAADFRSLRDRGSFVVVTDEEGDELQFRAPASGSTFLPEEASTDLTLTKQSNGTFTLADVDGNVTTFGPPGVDQRPTTVTQPGSATTTTFTYDSQGRILRVVAPNPTGAACTDTSWPTGCRGLVFGYDNATPSRLATISLKTNTLTLIVAQYSYDATPERRLTGVWDPRISPSLVTSYTYDGAGRLATVTPPGRSGWSFVYATDGALQSVSRPHPGGVTERMTVVYNVPLSAGTGRAAMAASDVARWGQTDVPTDATAVYPSRAHDANGNVNAADQTYATVTYMDVNGRPVNVATPGGNVTTTEYDSHGNVVRELTATNRETALASANPAQAAAKLDTRRIYSEDGIDLLDVYGPAHVMVLSDGTAAEARAHTHTDYDNGSELGHPSDGLRHVPVRVTTQASLGPDIGSNITDDPRVTTYEYALTRGDGSIDDTGWRLRKPLRTVVDPAGLNLSTTTLYDPSTGLLVERRLPKAPNGGTAQSTLFRYYAPDSPSGADPDCANKPDWARLPCKVLPAAQPGIAGQGDIPVSRTTNYNELLQPTTVVETSSEPVNGAVTTRTRTTTTSYDAAGRPTDVSVSSSIGEPLPTAHTEYDSATGDATGTSITEGAITSTIRRAYDSVGRLTSYTDADGSVATTTYDTDGRPTSASDGKGSYTYTYDAVAEPRGLPTSVAFSAVGAAAGGTISATYDADGEVRSQTYPNGLVATYTRDATATPTKLSYEKSGSQWLVFEAAESVHGQWRRAASSISTQEYGYDAAARLIEVADIAAGSCTMRRYTYDADSNRTARASKGALSDGSCNRAGAYPATPQRSYSYDAADRLVDPGYVYDAFGRTIDVPASDAGGSALRIGYFVNDMVRSQTQSGITRTWSLDPSRRLRRWTDATSTGVVTADRTNHYADDSDSAAWVRENADGSAWRRNVVGPDGLLAAVQDNAGVTELQLVNLHGDVAGTASLDSAAAGPSATFDTTEFGEPRDPAAKRRYAWLGGERRSADTLGSLVLMGVRLYNPAIGRFLQIDPVEGGSANRYDYANQDPVNQLDLGGTHTGDEGWRALKRAYWSNVINKLLPRVLKKINARKFWGFGPHKYSKKGRRLLLAFAMLWFRNAINVLGADYWANQTGDRGDERGVFFLERARGTAYRLRVLAPGVAAYVAVNNLMDIGAGKVLKRLRKRYIGV